MTIESCDFWSLQKFGMAFGTYGAADDPFPRFGLLLRLFVLDGFELSPSIVLDPTAPESGFPHPTGGFVIPGVAADGADTGVGFSHPTGAFVTPALDDGTAFASAVEGFPHPGGALVTPTLDPTDAFGFGTNWAVNVFAAAGAGAAFGGGA